MKFFVVIFECKGLSCLCVLFFTVVLYEAIGNGQRKQRHNDNQCQLKDGRLPMDQ